MIIRLTMILALILPSFLSAEEQELFGAEVCADCHDQGEEFADSAHGQAMARVDPEILEYSCESCHGDATAHIDDDPTPENIIGNPGSETCNNCHSEPTELSRLNLPAHQRNGIECLDCHAASHGEPGWKSLLIDSPLNVCGDCHPDQESAGHRPFAHRDGEQPFQCDQCHSGHQNDPTSQLSLQGKGAVCTDCHVEVSGPFEFPHPALEVNGCSSCHEPHGSTNPRLLTRLTTINLCMDCHPDVQSYHDTADSKYRACLSCHSAIHGSNEDAHFIDP